MPVPTLISDLDTTAASNSPPGGESVGNNVDNYIRAHAAFIAQLEANKLDSADAATTYQPLDALLTSLAGQTTAANKVQAYSAADTASLLDFKDEDDMASDSATAIPSQQSVKAYVDAAIAGVDGFTNVISYTGTGGVSGEGDAYSFSGSFPDDNTIPQITEGAPCVDVTITPSRAGVSIDVDALVQFGANGGANVTLCAALFMNSDANALKTGYIFMSASSSEVGQVALKHRVVAADTSPITFKVRVGAGGSSATQYVNRSSATSGLFGQTGTTYISAREV